MSASQNAEEESTTPPLGVVARQPVFATPHWSVVLTAGRVDAPLARESLDKLCQAYWYPLYVYVRRRGYNEADAKDLTQEFFARLLRGDGLGRADRQKGRFRSFLLASISHFLANEREKSRRQKRGGGLVITLPFGANDEHHRWEPADNLTPEQSFERRWALALLDQVMSRLRAEYAGEDKEKLFAELKPCLLGERTAQPYAGLASTLGMTEGSVKVAVYRLRQRYRQLLREEIANTVAKPEEIEDELSHLFGVFAKK